MGKRKGKGRLKGTLLTPVLDGAFELADSSGGDGREYWKRILPVGSIVYTDPDTGSKRPVTFDKRYHQSVIDSFNAGAQDVVSFQLADKSNSHTWHPEQMRGTVTQLAHGDTIGQAPGLWARVKFPNADAAKAVDLSENKLGVSASIQHLVERVDGKKFRNVLGQVLGTLRPRVVGLGDWKAINLSDSETENLIDLTHADFKEPKVAKKDKTKAPADTGADVDLSDEELDDLDLALAEALEGLTDDDLADADVDLSDVTDNLRPNVAGQGLELAAAVTEQGREILGLKGAKADAEWKRERQAFSVAGVPKADLDLAEPLMAGYAPAGTINLSDEDGLVRSVDARSIVRSLLENRKGTVDYTAPDGYDLADKDDSALDAQADAWVNINR